MLFAPVGRAVITTEIQRCGSTVLLSLPRVPPSPSRPAPYMSPAPTLGSGTRRCGVGEGSAPSPSWAWAWQRGVRQAWPGSSRAAGPGRSAPAVGSPPGGLSLGGCLAGRGRGTGRWRSAADLGYGAGRSRGRRGGRGGERRAAPPPCPAGRAGSVPVVPLFSAVDVALLPVVRPLVDWQAVATPARAPFSARRSHLGRPGRGPGTAGGGGADGRGGSGRGGELAPPARRLSGAGGRYGGESGVRPRRGRLLAPRPRQDRRSHGGTVRRSGRGMPEGSRRERSSLLDSLDARFRGVHDQDVTGELDPWLRRRRRNADPGQWWWHRKPKTAPW